jgi:hydrogenase maturation protease
MTLDERLAIPTTPTHVSRPSSTLLIGLGNPILGDDGVGWRIVESVEAKIAGDPRYHTRYRPLDSKSIQQNAIVEVDYLSIGGLSLMERILGYERVILVDSMETGLKPPGSVSTYALAELPNPSAGHSASAHDTSLITALQTAEAIGGKIPAQVDVVAVEAKQTYQFTEELSEAVSQAVPRAVNAVFDLLKK